MADLMKAGKALAVQQLLALNQSTGAYGLTLTGSQARALCQVRERALEAEGRVEFGGGVMARLAQAFCDSAYLTRDNYFDTLCQLTELFYHYKGETNDRIGDDRLIQIMKDAFEGPCRGSVELLAGRELFQLARAVRMGPGGTVEAEAEGEEEDEWD